MRKVICNSTPIISLHSINRMDILNKIYGEITIPNAVREEVDIKTKIIDKYDFFRISWIKDINAAKLFKTALHRGEVEVILLAQELKADLSIIDDLTARKFAEYMGLRITGTLGVLIKAKQMKIVDRIKPILDELIENKIYISDRVYNLTIELAGE